MCGETSLNRESGQGTLEYILLLFVITSFVVAALRGLGEVGVMDKLARPLKEDYARVYQFGHPKATGFENGETPYWHPRWTSGDNFRIFLWPNQAD